MSFFIRPASAEDRFAVSKLVLSEFHATAAQDMGVEGVTVFSARLAPDALMQRWHTGGCFVYEHDEVIVGYLDMHGCHINMLFVRGDEQLQGIGTALVLHGVTHAECKLITVRAFPGVVDWFSRRGFAKVSDWEERQNMRVLPMERKA